MASLIPIKNIYYMYCYAWNKFEPSAGVDVGSVDSPEPVDLFAKVLADGFSHLRRRGLDRGYVPTTEALSVLRGKVNLQESMQQNIRRSRTITCDFDEFHHDILNNQILKATIKRLLSTVGLDQGLRNKLGVAWKYLSDVDELRLSKQAFRKVQIHRNNSFYNFLLSICELIYDSTIPDNGGTRYQFSDLLRDEKRMALVFQDFVKHFFRIEQSEYEVTPLQLKWDAASSSEDLQMLPTMRTDIHLENSHKHIIIDTKYYREALQTNCGKSSIRSDNLYQLFSYLKNAEARGGAYASAEGILLYPAVGEKLALRAVVQGHAIRIHTINLDQPWKSIRADMLGLLTV